MNANVTQRSIMKSHGTVQKSLKLVKHPEMSLKYHGPPLKPPGTPMDRYCDLLKLPRTPLMPLENPWNASDTPWNPLEYPGTSLKLPGTLLKLSGKTLKDLKATGTLLKLLLILCNTPEVHRNTLEHVHESPRNAPSYPLKPLRIPQERQWDSWNSPTHPEKS